MINDNINKNDELENDSKNIYYCKLAIERKRELARQEKLVDPRIIQKELKKIVKEKNFAWKKKKEYNIKNNLDYKKLTIIIGGAKISSKLKMIKYFI